MKAFAGVILAVVTGIVVGDTCPFYEDKGDLLCWLGADGAKREVRNVEEWRHRRGHVLMNMQAVMGSLPTVDRSRPPGYEVLEERNFATYVRKTIRYAAEPGEAVSAFLFVPRSADPDKPSAAMLCLHPTSPLGKRIVAGEGERPNRNYGSELAERGYVVLAPDYPGFGDDVASRKRLYEQGYVSCTMKGIWNHIRGVDLLRSLPEVDAERMGCIGHSLGGHNALFAAVFDPRLKVVVTSCGFTTFAKYKRGDLTGWTHDGYMPRIATAYGKDAVKMPLDFTEVLGALAPRAVFINAPLYDDNFEVSGVREAVRAAEAVYALYGAKRQLRVVYPEAGHDFPDEVRAEAYAFLSVSLGGAGSHAK